MIVTTKMICSGPDPVPVLLPVLRSMVSGFELSAPAVVVVGDALVPVASVAFGAVACWAPVAFVCCARAVPGCASTTSTIAKSAATMKHCTRANFTQAGTEAGRLIARSFRATNRATPNAGERAGRRAHDRGSVLPAHSLCCHRRRTPTVVR